MVATVDSAPAPVTHFAAIARPGHWIAGCGRADIGIAHAHAILTHPTRIHAGTVVTAGERMTAAVGDAATVGAAGGPDAIGALIGRFAVRPADTRVLGRVARPSSGAVVATIDFAITAITYHAAIRPPGRRTGGGCGERNAGVDRPAVGNHHHQSPCVGPSACAAGVASAIVASATAADFRDICRSAGSAQKQQGREEKHPGNQDGR
jgi:hypothetical protein